MKVQKRIEPVRVLVSAWSTAIVLVFTGAALAAGVSQQIKFARGRTSTMIEQSVLRGERDRYTLRAHAGQKLQVSITSLEKNAAFEIYLPGRKKALKGAGETDDAMRWSGKLPVSGNYIIEVGSTRGNAAYKLSVALK